MISETENLTVLFHQMGLIEDVQVEKERTMMREIVTGIKKTAILKPEKAKVRTQWIISQVIGEKILIPKLIRSMRRKG